MVLDYRELSWLWFNCVFVVTSALPVRWLLSPSIYYPSLKLAAFLNHLIDSELGHEHPEAPIIKARHVLHNNTLTVNFT